MGDFIADSKQEVSPRVVEFVRGEKDALKMCFFDFAEDPDGVKELNLFFELFVLEVA